MLIKRDKITGYEYSLSFEYKNELIEYCQYLREKHGFRRFSFIDKAWRLKDLEIAVELRDRYKEIQIDKEIQMEYEMADYLAKDALAAQLNADRLKKTKESNLEIPGIKGSLLPYQKVGVEFFINSNGRAINADPMGCLSGKTKICVNIRKNAKTYTLEKAYVAFNKLSKRNGYGWKYPAYTRSYDEKKKEFRLNKIKKIILKGEMETLEIVAQRKNKKYKLELTPDHELITPGGDWVSCENLSIGDKILVNGKHTRYCPVCKKKTEYAYRKSSKFFGACKVCIYKNLRNNREKEGGWLDSDGYIRVGGVSRHPSAKHNKSGRYYAYQHVLVVEAQLNNTTYPKWLEKIRNNQLDQNSVFIDSKISSVHHINGIRSDNNIKNLQLLKVNDHCIFEGKNKTYLNLKETFLPNEATVVSINKKGKQKVYDIIMEDPHRSFIANGIVVHNSGKSLQALAYAVHAGFKKVIVICPALVKYNWKNEVRKWTDLKPLVIDSDNTVKDVLRQIDQYNVLIINYDILKKFFSFLVGFSAELLILDEFHYVKNNKADRTKLTKKISTTIPRIILLSGTPFLSRPIELFNGLSMLDRKTWFDFYAYGRRYCNGHMGRWGWDDKGVANISELQQRIAPYFIRRTKAEILPDLPKKRFINYPVQLEEETQKQYTLAEKSFGEFLVKIKHKTEGEARRSLQAEKLVKLGALRHLASMGKIESAQELISSIIENGEKVVVFSCYNDPIEILHKKFKNKSVIVTGKVAAEERMNIVNRFQEDKSIKIFFGGIKSAGVGINLTAATNVLFIDYSWVPADHMQAIDRIHRIGSTAEHITIYQLYSEDTVDEYMYKLLGKKQLLFDQLIDGKEVEAKVRGNYTTSIIRAIENKHKKSLINNKV